MGKMREMLERGLLAPVAVLGFTEIRIANGRPTLCVVEISTPKGLHVEHEVGLGQLRATVRELARAFNIIVDLQGLNAKKIMVDGEIPE